jgi:hypothetical protein
MLPRNPCLRTRHGWREQRAVRQFTRSGHRTRILVLDQMGLDVTNPPVRTIAPAQSDSRHP